MNNARTQPLTFWSVVALGVLVLGPNADAAIRGSAGYVTNTDGNIVMNETGSCWRNGSWTPADAIAACDTVAKPPQRVAMVEEKVVAAAAPVQAAPAPPVVLEKIILGSDTLFDFDKSDIKSGGRSSLDVLAAKLQGNERVIISTGFTSSPGSDEYNMKLSQRRAEAVKTYLVSKGIDGGRIRTVGKGEQDPVASNATADGRDQNRRVEIEVLSSSFQ